MDAFVLYKSFHPKKQIQYKIPEDCRPNVAPKQQPQEKYKLIQTLHALDVFVSRVVFCFVF